MCGSCTWKEGAAKSGAKSGPAIQQARSINGRGRRRMWCYDVPSCQQRYAQTPFFVSSLHWPESMTLTGIFDTDPHRSPLAGANKAYGSYCSSDAWCAPAECDSVCKRRPDAQARRAGWETLGRVTSTLLWAPPGRSAASALCKASSRTS